LEVRKVSVQVSAVAGDSQMLLAEHVGIPNYPQKVWINLCRRVLNA